MWVHSNSLIKNLTPFEDDAGIRLLNFLMQFIISQEQHSIKTLEFTETNRYFYSFTYEKNIFSGFILPVGRFYEFVCWQTE